MPLPDPGRRRCIGALAALGVSPVLHAAPEAPTGWVLPRQPAPPLALLDADGQRLPLSRRLRGHVTAVQLMFTGCNGSCPLQGALFGAVAAPGLPDDVRLLSISIDALGDTPATLRQWLGRFGAPAAWSAAVPAADDVEPLSAWLKGRAGSPGTHTSQVFLFDREAALRWRSGDLPPARDVRAWLGQLAA